MGFREWAGAQVKAFTGGFGTFDSMGSTVFTYTDNFELNLTRIMEQTPSELYESQPALRTVVDFLAENVAQTGLHVYQHDGKGGKERVRNTPLANVLMAPNEYRTLYEVIFALVADFALHDSAYLFVQPTTDPKKPFNLHTIPCSWIVRTTGGNAWAPEMYIIQPPQMPDQIPILASQMIAFHGWSPKSFRHGSSRVETLRLILSEQMHSYEMREQIWKKGGRFGGYLTRPSGAPEWSQETERKFMRNWNKRKAASGPDAGSDALLQDGMEYKNNRFSAHEEDFIPAAKLAKETVASVYQVNPTMIGVLDNANYSNTKEFRKMLYGETLGPYFKRITQRLNAMLLPMMGITDDVFLEFNIQEKMQGSFEEQASANSTAGGGPWMTINEIRGQQNLPALPGHDELIVPMNVTVGGQASPTDSAPPPKALTDYGYKAPEYGIKAIEAPHIKAAEVEDALFVFFKRQASSVLAKVGAGKDGWWDGERWNNELTDDLSTMALKVSQNGSGGSVDNYDAALHAFQINFQIQQRVSKALKAGISPATALDNAANALVSLAASDLVHAVTGN